MRFLSVSILCGLLLGVVSVGRAQAPDDPIARGFLDVPASARMRMFWRIFGPAWNRDEIDYQLGLLQQAHIGGVMTCFTYPTATDDPARNIHNDFFLSPTFTDLLRYAEQQARAHDIEFGVCGGTGWPFGGPTVTLRDAAQHLRMETPELLPDRTGYLLPALRDDERYLAAFCGRREVTALIRRNRLRVVTDEPCRIFIVGPTYMQVKRPALGGEGYVIDHLSRRATQRYLTDVVTPLLKASPDAPVSTLFCDSLEVYNANWTQDFPAQFRRRRGYDLIPHLPDLFDDASPEAADLRFDFWCTVAELAEQEFAQTVHEYCSQHNVSFALEAYGTPPMGLTAAQYCDVPWGEQYEWQAFSFSRLAASGGHLAGKKIIGAEAWTWAGIPNRLADSLADLKLCSDLHFLAGENELTGVDFPYSPRSVEAPGWLPYFGPVMNQNNPQWPYFGALTDYVNRCQWLLRQGAPIADVALYVPTEDAFASGPTNQMLLNFRLRDRLSGGQSTEEFGLSRALTYRSNVIATLLHSGYNYDGIDFFAMNQLAHVEHGELAAGDGRYRIVVLPGLTGIDLKAMEKIASFCQDGGVVIATRRLPDRVYGLDAEQAGGRLRHLIGTMFGADAYAQHRPAGSVETHPYGSGKAILVADDTDALRKALAQLPSIDGRLGPDMRTWIYSPDVQVESDVTFVHRRVEDRDYYFVVNLGDKTMQFGADFRTGGKAVTQWDPMTGAITPLPVYSGGNRDSPRSTSVSLTLPAHASTFLCFALGPTHAPVAGPPPDMNVQILAGTWHVTFDGPDAPPEHDTRDLDSWTGWPDARFFSGRAAYEFRFTLPVRLPHRCRLRFEQVREVGEVAVNGATAGIVWLPPYEIDITHWIKPGENQLRVTVANLPVNRVLGQPDPDLTELHTAYGDRFPAPQEKLIMHEPVPSGLIGRVTLITED